MKNCGTSNCCTTDVGNKLLGLAVLQVGRTRQQETGMDKNPFCELVEEADGLTAIEYDMMGP